jgi:hypothetical protein
MSDPTLPSRPTGAPLDLAELLADYSEEVSHQLRVVEEALDALTLTARSMAREAARARRERGP